MDQEQGAVQDVNVTDTLPPPGLNHKETQSEKNKEVLELKGEWEVVPITVDSGAVDTVHCKKVQQCAICKHVHCRSKVWGHPGKLTFYYITVLFFNSLSSFSVSKFYTT